MRQKILRIFGKLGGSITFRAADNGGTYELKAPNNLPGAQSNITVSASGQLGFSTVKDLPRQDLVLQNGWQKFYNNFWGTPSCIKINGVVYVNGLIQSGTLLPGTTFFQLPVGYRPYAPHLFNLRTASNGLIRLDFYTDGTCVYTGEHSGSPQAWTSLGGSTFPTY